MQKRGQVSAFILVGLFLSVVVGLSIMLFEDGFFGIFSGELDAVAEYTGSCMQNVARQGLAIMQLQGGYIELPKHLQIKPKAYIDAGYRVPLWYMDGRNLKPTIEMMERELAGYIDKNLEGCLNSYADFPLDIRVKGNLSSRVTIGYEDVDVVTEYPLEVVFPEETKTIDEFHAKFPSKFGRLYSLASELMDFENLDFFLENYTDEMMAASDYLPYEGIMVTCSPVLWREQELKEYTQTLVMHNLNFLMFENTDYTETGIPYYDKLYKVDFTRSDYSDIGVKVIYNPSWDMKFEVLPSSGGIAKPYGFKLEEFIPLCVKVMHHKYNMEFPVMFQLTDEKGERFYFASPVILRRSLPNRYNEVMPWPNDYSRVGNARFCANTTKVSVFTEDENGVIVATPAIRNNRENSLSAYAMDAVTGDILPRVNISYGCVSYLCDMGQTDYPRQDGLLTGEDPMLKAYFPECFGGFVYGEHPGYHKARSRATVSSATDGMQVLLEMYPLKQFAYDFFVVEEHNGLLDIRTLLEGESLYLELTNKDIDFEEQIIFPSDSEYYTNLTLPVGSFTYELEINLAGNEQYLGGWSGNWTVSKPQAELGSLITFYVLKKDMSYVPQTEKEWKAVLEYPLNNSLDYPPIVT